MFPETSRCAAAVLSPLSRCAALKELTRSSTHGPPALCLPQPRRHFSVSRRLSIRLPRKTPREVVHIPGLERVTYADRMHYVPGLAKPVNPHWERDYKDPRFYRSEPPEKMPLYKERPCYIFNQRTSVLEGVTQALWLTKTKMIPGLPPHLLSAADSPANTMPDQDERVQNAIRHARFWNTAEERPSRFTYCPVLLNNLIHLCATMRSSHPALGRRLFAENYSLGATWRRGDDNFQVRGHSGLLHSCMDPLPAVSGVEEVAETADHTLETFSPLSPSIDLQKTHVYREEVNATGFKDGYSYPHAHTLYFLDRAEKAYKLLPDQFRSKMLMFAFGNALARARLQYGTEPQSVLERPITVQAVGTNGRFFEFLVFQLNTTDLSGDDGVKNQVWLDGGVELYEFAKVRPKIKKKQVVVPAGLAGYKPETFKKFLALFLHGAL